MQRNLQSMLRGFKKNHLISKISKHRVILEDAEIQLYKLMNLKTFKINSTNGESNE